MKRLLTLGAATLVALTAGCKSEPLRPRTHQTTPAAQQGQALPTCEGEPFYLAGKVLREESCPDYALLIGTSEGNYALQVTGNVSALAAMLDEGDIIRIRAGYKVTNGPCWELPLIYPQPHSSDGRIIRQNNEIESFLPLSRRGAIRDNYIELVEKAGR